MTVDHSLGSLLGAEEQQRLRGLLGYRKRAMATAVVQLFFAAPPNYNSWAKVQCGVATMIKDGVRRSYFIQVYDLASGTMVWEQEFYDGLLYNNSCSFFHTFEAHDRPAGLNFADPEEASSFAAAVLSRVRTRQRRQDPVPPQPAAQVVTPALQSTPSPATDSVDVKASTADKRKGGGRKGRKKILKGDIGMPTDFRHERHIGFDTKMPDVNVGEGDDWGPLLSKFMNMYGVDPENEEFVRKLVAKNGGLDRLKREMQVSPSPGAARNPLGQPPRPPGGNLRAGPPPPPPPGQPQGRGRGMPPPPPPPAGRGRLNCPLPPPPGPPPPGPPTRPGGMGAPPPPPPGPPTRPGGQGPPPPPPPPGPPAPGGMGAPPPPPPPPPPSAGGPPPPPPVKRPKEMPEPQDGRDQMLQQIRGFSKALRPVEPRSQSPTTPPSGGGGLAELLMHAMASRSGLRDTDSENSDDFEEDEWDDES